MFITVSQHARLSEAVRSLVQQVLPDDLDVVRDAISSAIAAALSDRHGQFRRAPITVPTWSEVTEDLVSIYNNVLATAATSKFR